MYYPKRLLPEKDSKIIQENEIKSVENDYLCRRVNKNITLKDKFGKLSPEAIEEKELFRYSMNKIPPSKENDINIKVLSPDPFLDFITGCNNLYKQSEIKFEILEDNYFKFQIKKIHSFEGIYPKNVKNKKKEYKFIVKVIHRPSIVNISHFELNTFSNGGKINYTKRPWLQLVIHLIRTKLIRIAEF